jgi:hypothetical protein
VPYFLCLELLKWKIFPSQSRQFFIDAFLLIKIYFSDCNLNKNDIYLEMLLLEHCDIGCSWGLCLWFNKHIFLNIKGNQLLRKRALGDILRWGVWAFAQRFIPLATPGAWIRGDGRNRLFSRPRTIRFISSAATNRHSMQMMQTTYRTAPITHETLETIKTQLAFKLTQMRDAEWEDLFWAARKSFSLLCRILTHGARHLTPSQDKKNSRLRVTGFCRTT